MKRYYFIFFLFLFWACKNSREEAFKALEKFDNSLDSLITIKTFNKPNILVFLGDTLKNNPTMIEETYFMILGKDSIKVDANCGHFQFQNNELLLSARGMIIKYIYFDDKIDNKLLDELRRKSSDTVYIGNLNKYDDRGNIIKTVKSSIWAEMKNGVTIINDNRILEIYKPYSKDSVTIWRKEYFNKKYDASDITNTKVTIVKSDIWHNPNHKYIFKFDKFGNWIEKRSKNENDLNIQYRKYHY
jgi:hypothetical protein